MGNFVKDKKQGDIAENLVMEILNKQCPNQTFERVAGRFSDYDIIEKTKAGDGRTIEVKFDIRASESGNLCFEISNGKKPTGILASKADEVWYVIKSKGTRFENFIFKFNRVNLIQHLIYLYGAGKARYVSGGDKWKFVLLLVPIETILEYQQYELLTYPLVNKNLGAKKHIPKNGTQYGQWTIISEEKYYLLFKNCKDVRPAWKVQCGCGTIRKIDIVTITSGKSLGCQSCGNIKLKPFETFINQAQKGANVRNIVFDINVDDIEKLIIKQKYKCALSGIALEINHISSQQKSTTASLDRIDSSKGYIRGNVQWVHKDVNRIKLDYKQDYFVEMCVEIAKHKGVYKNGSKR